MKTSLNQLKEFIERFAQSGGPEPTQYDELYDWFELVANQKAGSILTEKEYKSLRPSFGLVFQSLDNIQGRTFLKPLGYAGDYQVIDWFYQSFVSQDPAFKKWDEFVQAMAPAQAVRNRKTYFKSIIAELVEQNKDGQIEVLNLACGPCRDVLESLLEERSDQLFFDCVDNDPYAIEFGAQLLSRHSNQVRLIQQNVLRAKLEKTYDLIWSAGLFDYFNDRGFVALLKRFRKWLKPTGRIVVGNFSNDNPAKHAMEFSEWILEYRNEEKLFGLGLQAGFSRECLRLEKEPTSINLFLHLALQPI